MSFILLGILNSQAAGAVPEPAFLSSAPLWLDAADASTITESGGSVSQWDNKGTLENFTQATSADQPTTGTLTQNGLNVLDFNDDFLTGLTKSQWKFLHDGTTVLLLSVVKFGNSASPAVGHSLIGNDGNNSGNIGLHSFYDDKSGISNRYKMQISNSQATLPSIDIKDDDFITPNQFNIISQITDPDAPTADRIDYFLNSVTGSETNTDSTSPSSSDPTFNLEVGRLGSGGNELVGQIAELIIVSGADATEENRQLTVDYLNTKWGVF